MNADGTGTRRLVGGKVNVGEPVWSPDGSKIVLHLVRFGTRAVDVSIAVVLRPVGGRGASLVGEARTRGTPNGRLTASGSSRRSRAS